MASRAAMDTLAENLAHPNSKEILKSHNLDSIQKLADIMPEEKLTRYSKIIGKMKKSQPIDIPKANSLASVPIKPDALAQEREQGSQRD